eukprot:TRINITY_DN1814_c0_g1_i1.p1 TRINITY_DN1814_c0_g1~~TRINITY_DN1814_c0_g1_i1.p1  ORF type:complete len:2188 (+),score=514.04 TRINITY_DN1814_c0_g1_i1:72-6635(+)
MIRRPPRSTLSSSSAASDVYKRQRGGRLVRACVSTSAIVTLLLSTMLRFEGEYMWLSLPFALSFALTLFFLANCKFSISRLRHWVATLPLFTDPRIAHAEREQHFQKWAPWIVRLIHANMGMTVVALASWGTLILVDAEESEGGGHQTQLGVVNRANYNKPSNDNSSVTPQTTFLYGLFLMVVGPGLCMSAYGVLQWKVSKFMLSLEIVSSGMLGAISIHLYFFLLIFARGIGGKDTHDVEEINYFGLCIVLLCTNMYCIVVLIYRNKLRPEVDVIATLNKAQGASPSHEHLVFLQSKILSKTNLFIYGCSWVVLAVLSATVKWGPMEEGTNGLGVIVAASVVYVDILVFFYHQWRMVQGPLQLVLISLLSRVVIVSFPTGLWFLGQCTVFALHTVFLAVHSALMKSQHAQNEDRVLLTHMITQAQNGASRLDENEELHQEKLQLLTKLVKHLNKHRKRSGELRAASPSSTRSGDDVEIELDLDSSSHGQEPLLEEFATGPHPQRQLYLFAGAMIGFTVASAMVDNIEFPEVPLDQVVLWHNSYSQGYIGYVCVAAVFMVWMLLTCFSVYHKEMSDLEEAYDIDPSILMQASWVWSSDPFKRMIELEEQHRKYCLGIQDQPVLPALIGADGKEDEDDRFKFYFGVPSNVVRVIKYYTIAETVCLIAGLLLYFSRGGHRILGGSLLFLPPAFFIGTAFLRTYRFNECHFWHRDAIFRYFRHRHDDKVWRLLHCLRPPPGMQDHQGCTNLDCGMWKYAALATKMEKFSNDVFKAQNKAEELVELRHKLLKLIHECKGHVQSDTVIMVTETLETIRKRSGQMSKRDLRMAGSYFLVIVCFVMVGVVIAFDDQRYSDLSPVAVGVTFSYLLVVAGACSLAYMTYVAHYGMTSFCWVLVSCALSLHLGWGVFMQLYEFDYLDTKEIATDSWPTVLTVMWFFGGPSLVALSVALQTLNAGDVNLKEGLLAPQNRVFALSLLGSAVCLTPMLVLICLTAQWTMGISVIVASGAIGVLSLTYLKYVQNDFYLPTRWYYPIGVVSVAVLALAVLLAVIHDWWFIGFSVVLVAIAIMLVLYGSWKLQKAFQQQDQGRQLITSPKVFPVYEILPSDMGNTEVLKLSSQACLAVLCGCFLLNYWAMLAAVWWRVECVAVCALTALAVATFLISMAGVPSADFGYAVGLLFRDELHNAMQQGFLHSQQHYKSDELSMLDMGATEKSIEFGREAPKPMNNFGFGLCVKHNGEAIWDARKPFTESAYELWLEYRPEICTLAHWQGVFDSNTRNQEKKYFGISKSQYNSDSLTRERWASMNPGRKASALDKHRASHIKSQEALKWGLVRSQNVDGAIEAQTAAQYVRFDFADLVYHKKYENDLKCLAHFVGHVIMQAHLRERRRDMEVARVFSRLKMSGQELVRRVLKNQQLWEDFRSFECPREGDEGPLARCCGKCEQQMLYLELSALVKKKSSMMGGEQKKPEPRKVNSESVDKVEAKSLSRRIKAQEELQEYMGTKIQSAGGMVDGLTCSAGRTLYDSESLRLAKEHKVLELQAAYRRRHDQFELSKEGLNTDQRAMRLDEAKAAEEKWETAVAQVEREAGGEYDAALGWSNLEANHRVGVMRRGEQIQHWIEEDDFCLLADGSTVHDIPFRKAYRIRGIAPVCESCAEWGSEIGPETEIGDGVLSRFNCARGDDCHWAKDAGGDQDSHKFEELVQALREKGEKYVDTEFPANDSSIYMKDTVADFQVARWAPLAEVYGVNFDQMVINVNGGATRECREQGECPDFQPDDVKQGVLSDCWFLSALTVTAQQYPELLRTLPEQKQEGVDSGCFMQYEPDVGACAIRFWKNFKRWTVIIDDKIPVTENNQPAFADARYAEEKQTGLWVPLIEKAYAKLHRSYEALSEGFVSDGLADLTHGIGDQYTMTDPAVQAQIERGEFWAKLKSWHRAKHLLGAGTPDVQNGGEEKDRPVIDGIVQGHAYAILDVEEEGGHKLVKLRNPWANEVEWTGAWSDQSEMWTERMKKKLNFVASDDGEFWMSFDDFCQMFLYLFVCRIFSDSSNWVKADPISDRWFGRSAGGGPTSSNFGNNPQYLIEADEPLDAFITLTQDDKRSVGQAFYHISLWLLRSTGDRVMLPSNTNVKTRSAQYSDFRTSTVEISFEAGERCVLVPTTFDPGLEGKFSIDIYSNKPLSVTKLASDV